MHWIFIGIAIGIGVCLTPYVIALIVAPFVLIAELGKAAGQSLCILADALAWKGLPPKGLPHA